VLIIQRTNFYLMGRLLYKSINFIESDWRMERATYF
jgi:hypothetical protein